MTGSRLFCIRLRSKWHGRRVRSRADRLPTDNGQRTTDNCRKQSSTRAPSDRDPCGAVASPWIGCAGDKSLAADPVETEVVEEAAQETAAGRRRAGGRRRIRVGATSAAGAGGWVPKGTPGSSTGGRFTLGSASTGPVVVTVVRLVGGFISARAGPCIGPGCSAGAESSGPLLAAPGAAGRRLPGRGGAGASGLSSSNGSPGGVGNGAWFPRGVLGAVAGLSVSSGSSNGERSPPGSGGLSGLVTPGCAGHPLLGFALGGRCPLSHRRPAGTP